MTELVIGSRGSKLALWQARYVKSRIEHISPKTTVSIEIIKTSGDKMTDVALAKIGGKGVFVKEIEEALLEDRIDLAVHSLKDVPTELPGGLELSTVLKREDPRDCLVALSSIDHFQSLPAASRIGTGSLRRTVQLRHLLPEVEIVPIRGNVDTRLRKLEEIPLDGIVLAASGLRRLGLEERISFPFSLEQMTPAVGQGALALETRSADARTRSLLSPLEDNETRLCVEAEREFLKRMGGGCQVPMGAHASCSDGFARFLAVLASPENGRILRKTLDGRPEQLLTLAAQAAGYLLEHGAREILEELEG